jgi:hypothetical protein
LAGERIAIMLGLKDLKKDRDLVDVIDWSMTPEEAVRLYLEWGNNWSRGTFIKSKDDVIHYFVLNCWEEQPVLYLVRRNSEEAVELAKIEVPDSVGSSILRGKYSKGIYGIDDEITLWLKRELDAV